MCHSIYSWYLSPVQYITGTYLLYRRTADVRSVGYSELIVLSRDDVLTALKDHPEAEVMPWLNIIVAPSCTSLPGLPRLIPTCQATEARPTHLACFA